LKRNEKYASNSKEQLEINDNVSALSARAYTPLLLVKHEGFITLMVKRNPRLNMISRTWLTRSLIKKNRRDSQKCVTYVDPNVARMEKFVSLLDDEYWMLKVLVWKS
jgi:hypothetical protein